MKMTVIFNEKKGVINLTSHNVVIEDFKSHICKRLKINPLDYKLKVDFLNNSIEPILISAKDEKMEMKQKPKAENEKLLANVSVVYRDGEKIYLYKDCYATLRGGSIWQVRDSSTIKDNNHLDLPVIDRGVNPRTQKEFVLAVRAIQIKSKKRPTLNLDSRKSCKKLAYYLGDLLKKHDSEVNFVEVGVNTYSTPQTTEISVHFHDTPDGEALTYFGKDIKDYNKPLHSRITKTRREKIYGLIKSYLNSEVK